MAGIRRIEELIAWQLSVALKEHVFTFTAKPAVARHRDFCADFRRSARSAPANLAEGFGRFWPRDNAKFVRMALGSLAESQNHLKDALKERYITQDEFSVIWRFARRSFGASTRWHEYLMSCSPGDPSKWLHSPGKIIDVAEPTSDQELDPAVKSAEPRT
jgi:four helix bundle protein